MHFTNQTSNRDKAQFAKIRMENKNAAIELSSLYDKPHTHKHSIKRGTQYLRNYQINDNNLARICEKSGLLPQNIILQSAEELTEKFNLTYFEAIQVLKAAASYIAPASSITSVWHLTSRNNMTETYSNSKHKCLENTKVLSSSMHLLQTTRSNTENVVNISHKSKSSSISTGISMLDALLMGGLRLGTLVELTGLSGCNKTNLALAWSIRTACFSQKAICVKKVCGQHLQEEFMTWSRHFRNGVLWLYTNARPPESAQISAIYRNTEKTMEKEHHEQYYQEQQEWEEYVITELLEPLIWFTHVEDMDSFSNSILPEIEHYVECCNEHHKRAEAANNDNVESKTPAFQHSMHNAQQIDDKTNEEVATVSMVVLDNFTTLVRRAYAGSSNDGLNQQIAISQLLHKLKRFAERCNVVILLITEQLFITSQTNNASEFGKIFEHAINVRLALIEEYSTCSTINSYIDILKSPTCGLLRIAITYITSCTYPENWCEEQEELEERSVKADGKVSKEINLLSNNFRQQRLSTDEILASVDVLDYSAVPTFIFVEDKVP